MVIQLSIDDKLLQEAQMVGHHSDEVSAVMAALTEYIRRHKQKEIVDLFGKIDYDQGYDYKSQRNQT